MRNVDQLNFSLKRHLIIFPTHLFFNSFGRGNAIHPHAWNYANKPLMLSRMYGGGELRNPGLQISWLTSLPWYSEIIFSSQNSKGDTAVSFRPDGKMRTLDNNEPTVAKKIRRIHFDTR